MWREREGFWRMNRGFGGKEGNVREINLKTKYISDVDGF